MNPIIYFFEPNRFLVNQYLYTIQFAFVDKMCIVLWITLHMVHSEPTLIYMFLMYVDKMWTTLWISPITIIRQLTEYDIQLNDH